MTKYIPILIMDEDDTPKNYSMSLREFLETIDYHVKNVNGATPDNVFVNLTTVEYENDDFFELAMAEISFSVKKDD